MRRMLAKRCSLWGVFLVLGMLGAVTVAVAAEPERPAARDIPAQGLIAYLEYDGVAAHAAAWQATAAHAMLNETTAGAVTVDLERQLIDRLLKQAPGADRGVWPTGAALVALQEHLASQGFSAGLYIEKESKDGVSLVVVLNGVGKPDLKEKLQRDRLLRLILEGPNGKPAKTVTLRGRTLQVGQAWTIDNEAQDDKPAAASNRRVGWLEGDDLVLIEGPARGVGSAQNLPARVAAVLDAIEGKVPTVLTHPGRAAALAEGKDIAGFEANGLVFIELGKDERSKMVARVRQVIDEVGAPYQGLNLPSGRYMHDDVQFFPPGPVPAPLAVEETSPKARTTTTPELPVGLVPSPELPPLPIAPLPPTVKAIPEPGPKDSGVKPVAHEERNEKNDPAATIQNYLDKVVGLEGVTRVVGRFGFQGKALLTDVRVETRTPRTGLVRALDQPALSKFRLPPVPKNATDFVVVSISPDRVFDTVSNSLFAMFESENGGAADNDPFPVPPEMLKAAFRQEFETTLNEMTGVRFDADLWNNVGKHLGPTWWSFTPRTKVQGKKAPAATFVVETDDAEAVGKALDALETRFQAFLKNVLKNDANEAAEAGPEPLPLVLERLPAPERGYRLLSPGGLIPWIDDDLQPTVLLGRSHLVLAASPARARQALAVAEGRTEDQWRPEGEAGRDVRQPAGRSDLVECARHGRFLLARDIRRPARTRPLPGQLHGSEREARG